MSIIHYPQDIAVWAPDSLTDLSRNRAAEIARFEAYYATGGKLFSREVLALVADQIDAANEAFGTLGRPLTTEDGVVVRIPDIEGGNPFEFVVHLGKTHGDAEEEGGEYFVRKIIVGYNAWREFRAPSENDTSLSVPTTPLAWHSLVINHVLATRDCVTKEIYGIEFGPGPSTRYPITPADVLTERLGKAVGKWQEEKTRLGGTLPTKIPSLLARPLTPKITKIVGFGLGSMADPYSKEIGDSRPIGQHSLLITLAAMVADAQGQLPAIISQDPGYLPPDISALATFGVRVVEDPRGFVEVDDSTLILTIGCNAPVEQIVGEFCRPAAFLTSDLTQPGLNMGSPRTRSMVQDEYETVELFDKEDDSLFRDLMWLMILYTRK